MIKNGSKVQWPCFEINVNSPLSKILEEYNKIIKTSHKIIDNIDNYNYTCNNQCSQKCISILYTYLDKVGERIIKNNAATGNN